LLAKRVRAVPVAGAALAPASSPNAETPSQGAATSPEFANTTVPFAWVVLAHFAAK
jgi:hypothetical protein